MFSVLYVDDEPGLLEIGKVYLENFGDFSVSTVESAPAALESLKTDHFDAIISDYHMPVMDGLEFLKQVRLRHGNVPFILFTGRGREEVVILALNLGADFYLQKGGDPRAQFAELAHKIRQAVQRRRMESALEESERRYRAVIESQTELICRFLPDGTLLFVNSAFCAYYGKAAGDLIGRRLDYRIHPDDQERNRQHFASLTAATPVGTVEHRVLMPDGTIRWQQWTDRAIFDECGKIAEYQSVGRDITDRRLAEEAMEKSENLYRTVFDTTGAATVIIAPDTTILHANTGWEELTGMPRAEQEGKVSWTIFFGREDTARMVQYHHDRRKDPALAPPVYESRLIDVNGQVHDCVVHVNMIPGTKNSVASLVDISDRKKSGESLAESEEKFRVMAENSPVAIVVYQENRIIYVNDYTAATSGYSKEELYRKDFWDLFPPDCRDAIRERGFARQRGEDVPGSYEVRQVTRNGEIRWAFLSTGKIQIGGKTAGIAMLVDITDRKRAEESLRESEGKFRALAEHAPVAIGVIQDNRYVYMNSHLVRALGYTREEIASLDFWVHVREDQQQKIRQDSEAWARGEAGPWTNELEYTTKSGERKWAVSTAAHIMYGGRHAGIVAMVGITERKKAEEELRAAYEQLTATGEELRAQYEEVVQRGQRLRESEEKLQGILDNIQDVYYRSDRDGNLIMFSPSGARLLGYDNPDEFLGQSIAGKVYANPEDRAAFLKAISRNGSVHDYEAHLRHKSGAVITISASSHYYYGPDGEVAGVEGIFRDITEKKRAEEELKRSENLYRTVFETTGAATILIGPDTTILRANASFEKLTGVPRQEMENKTSWTVFIDKDDVERMKEYHYARRKAPAGIPTVYECRLIDAETKVHSCYVYVDVIPGTENSIASLIDITPVKGAEAALREANRKLNLLTGITRHDIKNQLAVLRGFLKLLEQGEKDTKLKEYCRKAAASAERIASMIQFTREYELLGNSPPSWQDLRTLVDAEVMQAPIGTIIVESAIPAGLEVLADPLIAKVIHNLMDNTLRHGGKVSVIRISVRENGNEKVLVWEDDGVGVPAAEKELIFEQGFGRNTGHGLTLSREILAITGLTIRESGDEGRGARFEITVPRESWRIAGR